MAYYTYDDEADALYIYVLPEDDVTIARTEPLSPTVHIDIDSEGRLVGVEVLSPRAGNVDLSPVEKRFGIELKIPFNFAA